MRVTLYILALLLLVYPVKADVDPTYTHNMFNHMTINPGFAGSTDMINLAALNRTQWLGFPGAPKTNLFSANAPLSLFGKTHGIGLTIIQDKFGLQTDLSLRLNYSYRMKVGDGMLGIGGYFGMIQDKLDASGFITYPGSSANDDPNIPKADKNGVYAIDVGLGAFYNTNKLYFGISTTHLNAPKIKYNTGNTTAERMFYVTSGYSYQLNNPLFELVPSLLLQTEGRTVQVNLNTNLVYNNRVWGGMSFRPGESVTGLLGTELISGLKFGYAYDFVMNNISVKTHSTHEIVVNYSFKLKKERLPQKYKSIRFL